MGPHDSRRDKDVEEDGGMGWVRNREVGKEVGLSHGDGWERPTARSR